MISAPVPSNMRASTSISPFKNGSIIAGTSLKVRTKPGPRIRT